MSRLKLNVMANYAGTAWVSLLALVLVPFYLRILGTEAYGLVGFLTALRAALSILDLGLGSVVSREVALTRTIEIIYWVVGIALCLVLILSSNAVAGGWLKAEELSAQTIQQGLVVFAVTVAVSWPVAVYRGVMRALERQVLYNGLLALTSTIRGAGALLAIVLVAPTVTIFLLWQLVASAIEVTLMGIVSWRVLQAAGVTQRGFDLAILYERGKFIASVSAISILAIAISQVDRLYVSKLLVLEQLGYYTVALTLASAVYRLVGPIATAVGPRLTISYSLREMGRFEATYERANRVVAFLVAPAAMALAFFGEDILHVWLQSAEAAAHSHVALAFLAIGNMLAAMIYLSPWLQYAADKTRFQLYFNLTTLIWLVPGLYVAISKWGIDGAAACAMLISVAGYAIVPIIMRRKILKREHDLRRSWAGFEFVVLSASTLGSAWTISLLSGASFGLRVILMLFGLVMYAVISYGAHKREVNDTVLSFVGVIKSLSGK
jgi:O-antigen/teichoic acid export membrane protein